MTLRLYIAGPMRGYPGFNFAAFDAAKAALYRMGHHPVSPADHDRREFPGHDWTTSTLPEGWDIKAALRWDLQQVLMSDGIVLLPGWELSEGVAVEKFVAEQAGIPVFLYQGMCKLRNLADGGYNGGGDE